LPHFAEAARLKTKYPAAFLSLGMAARRPGKFDEAVKAYREALRLNPDFLARI